MSERYFALLPQGAARSLAKVKVLEGGLTGTTGHGPTAGAARYLAIDGLGSCLARPDDPSKGTILPQS